jgi:hypothetical protein
MSGVKKELECSTSAGSDDLIAPDAINVDI